MIALTKIHVVTALLVQSSNASLKALMFTSLLIPTLSPPQIVYSQTLQAGNTLALASSDTQLTNKPIVKPPEQIKLESLEKQLEEEKEKRKDLEKKLEDTQKYNDNLMNTVFFSLLGSVITVAAGFLGFKVVVDVLDRDNQKKVIVEEAKSDLSDWLDEQLFPLRTRIQWLEYQTASLAADQTDEREGLERICAIQDRLRAMGALQQICNGYHEEDVSKCIVSEFQAIKKSLEKIVNQQKKQPSLQNRIPELAGFNKRIQEGSVRMLETYLQEVDISKLNLNEEDIEKVKGLLLEIKL